MVKCKLETWVSLLFYVAIMHWNCNTSWLIAESDSRTCCGVKLKETRGTHRSSGFTSIRYAVWKWRWQEIVIDCASVHRVVALIFDHEPRHYFGVLSFRWISIRRIPITGQERVRDMVRVKSSQVKWGCGHRHTVPLYPHIHISIELLLKLHQYSDRSPVQVMSHVKLQ